MFLLFFVLAVFVAALFLYLLGLVAHSGFLYSLAVLFLLVFAIAGAIAFAFLVHALFRRWCERRGKPPKGQGTHEGSGPPSVHLPPTIYKRPDPLIYSQYFLMAQGLAVSWDNPDIRITELPAGDGSMAPVASDALQPGHTYRVHARIHNGSTDAPAVGMPVVFSFLAFGIGITSTPIGVQAVTLPVKGAVGEPAEAWHDWTTPAEAGHFCLQVALIWPDDLNPANNLGQENVVVGKLNSPKAVFTFPVRNDAPRRRKFHLEVDTYPTPTPPPCPPRDATTPPVPGHAAGRRRDAVAAHRRAAHPLPAGWTVSFAPGADFVLDAEAQIEVTVTVMVPDHLAVPRPINVNAFADGVLAGGVTLYVHS